MWLGFLILSVDPFLFNILRLYIVKFRPARGGRGNKDARTNHSIDWRPIGENESTEQGSGGSSWVCAILARVGLHFGAASLASSEL